MYVSSKRDITLQKQFGVGSPGTQLVYFWWPLLLEKCQKAQIPYVSPFSCKKIWHHHFTWSGPNLQEIVNFVPIVGPPGTKLEHIHNLLWIWSTSGQYGILAFGHLLSKDVLQNLVLGSPGTHFKHMRVKKIRISEVK